MSIRKSIDSVPALPVVEGVEFRHIAGWPGYAVASNGTVWSCLAPCRASPGYRNQWKQRIASEVDKYGHLRVTLHNREKLLRASVHGLVLEAFIGPKPEGMECCHFPDPNPANNHVSNLRWGTHLENCQDIVRMGRTLKGSRHNLAKLTEENVLEIRRRYAAHEADTYQLAEQFNVTQANISCVIRRETWTHI